MKRPLLLYLLVLFYIPLFSQISIQGTIISKSDQLPIIGANILEKGSSNGTISDDSGQFQLTVSENAILEISYLGYLSQSVQVDGQKIVSILLEEDIQQLEGVVVTAFGIEREKKAAGFAFSEIDGEELTQAREVNVAAQLVGKVAGLDISKPSNGPAGATRITIRGLSQFQGDNRPLIVIDGIPVDNSNVNRAGLYGGRDSGDGLSALSPDDIESITVLKGPTAASLYGSRAGNGVVLITTKKGKTRKGIGVEFTSNYVTEEATILPNYQQEYGQGANGQKPSTQQEAFDNWRSWGAQLDGSLTPIFNGDSIPYAAVGQDDIRSYYQTGSTWTNSIALTGGNETTNARLSFSNLTNTSIVPRTEYDRTTINFTARSQLTDGISISGKVSYIIENSKNRTNLTDNPSNPSKYFTIGPANLPHEVFRQTRNALGDPIYWSNNPFTISPYWGPFENINEDTKNRILGYVSARWEIIKGLSIQGRAAIDDSNQEFLNVEIDGTQHNIPGSIFIDQFKIQEQNFDLIVNANRSLGEWLNVDINLGAARTNQSTTITNTTGSNFINPGFISINNLANRNPGRINFSESRINGILQTPPFRSVIIYT